MRDNVKNEWNNNKNILVSDIVELGFPKDLGEQIAKQLGSPRAMDRMISYLRYVKPRSAELIVDEMLAICADIEAWKNKKYNEQANASYNDILNYGFNRGKEE